MGSEHRNASAERAATAGSSVRRGLVCGALAGVWLAFADYGALWLWLPVGRDRAWLLARLLASFAPLGALLGAVVAGLATASWRWLARGDARRAPRLWPVPFVLAGAPASSWLASKLCSGGMMSRLAERYPLRLALSLLLPCALYALLWLGARAAQRLALAGPRARFKSALWLLGASALLEKANQLILPNLYDYLHGLLALAVWALAAFGFGLSGLASARAARFFRIAERPSSALLVALTACAIGVLNARTLDQNLNVRVAMFDARSPSSRTLLRAVDPWLRRLPEANAARRGRPLTRSVQSENGLPTARGAHVLLVTIDALRADHLGTYGYSRAVSPELDRFAQGASVFERAYAQAPHSSYSLSSLHTSDYVHELVELGRPLPQATLASALAAAGYHSAAFFTDGIFHTEGAKLHALRDGAFGFALFDLTNRESEQQTERVLAEVERIKQRGEPPSLLWVHYFDVHEPYQETTFGSGEMDRYDSEILHVDRELSRLIRELERRFTRPLVIAISADHGEEFREHGGVYHGSSLYDEQVRVPLILRVPGLTPGRVAAPVEVIDIAPTLLRAVAAPVPPGMRGRDLRAIAGRTAGAEPVFSAVLTKRMALKWPHKLIADLRFGLFELYDLERDPEERRNLAGAEPARLAELRELAYRWLDSIEAHSAGAPRADADWQRALQLGRLGDRRAVAATVSLLLDRAAPTELRQEAGQNLAKLADPSAVPGLLAALETEPAAVAQEAAIALGRMHDPRAHGALRKLMHVEDPHLRARAAISLGRLRDRAAVPALIDALWIAPTQYEREEAVRWLGRLRDPAAVEPLLSLLPEFSLRYLLAVALGEIGDPRAYEPLVSMLDWESRTNIRDEVVRGLGLLGEVRAIPSLVAVFDREPGLKNTAESLIRLGAPERGALGGSDVGPRSKGLSGFGACKAGPLVHDWDYLQRTHCTTLGPRAQQLLPLPSGLGFGAGAQLVLRARRSDAPESLTCAVELAGESLGALRVDGEFRERRFELRPELLRGAQLTLAIECGEQSARLTLDHALIVPRTQTTAGLLIPAR